MQIMSVPLLGAARLLGMLRAHTRLLQSPAEAKDSGTTWHLEGLDYAHQ